MLWITDPHIDHLNYPVAYLQGFSEQYPDTKALLITGDIGTALSLRGHLNSIHKAFPSVPIYFVLGNHDFYYGSIAKLYSELTEKPIRGCTFLDIENDPIEVSESIGLVGHTGWYSGDLGIPWTSRFIMTDWEIIKEMRALYNHRLWSASEFRKPLIDWIVQYSERATLTIRSNLLQAAEQFDKVIILTHFPPFRQATWHEGRESDDYALPWFTNSHMGNLLDETSKQYPGVQFLCLCGHSHGSGIYQHSHNLRVWTGLADYGSIFGHRLGQHIWEDWDASLGIGETKPILHYNAQ